MATKQSKIDWARSTPPAVSMDTSDRLDAILILRDALTECERERDAVTRAHNAISKMDTADIERIAERNRELETALHIIDALGRDMRSHVRNGETHIPGCCPFCIANTTLAAIKAREDIEHGE